MGVLHSSGYVWWIERGKIAIGITSNAGVTVTPPSTAGHVIRVYSKEIAQVQKDGSTATSFTTGTNISLVEYSLLPEQFHEALIAKVVEKLFRKDIEGIQMSEYWSSVYESYVLKGKKYANQARVDTGFNVSQHDM